MSCYICLEDLSLPVSIPCGHVFCHDCLKRAIQAVQPYSTLHACPTCRSHYHLDTPLDVSVVPRHLRPHLSPSIRKIYIDLPSSKTQTSSTGKSQFHASTEIARLRAENEALRHNCSMWRKRAEAHSAVTLGLLELSRLAKDQALQVARERDTIHRDYLRLCHNFQRQQAVTQAMVVAPPQNIPESTTQLSLLATEPSFGDTKQNRNIGVSIRPDANPLPAIGKPSRKRLRTEES